MKILGIDIGGTSVKAGVLTPDGALEATASFALEDAIDALGSLVAGVGATPDDIAGIGLDVPGPVDAAGNVGMLPNIDFDVPALKAALREAFPQAKLAFVNDANAAALGELWQGAAHGETDFVLVALGTGVGAGVVANGQPISGAFGAGGEIGHLTVNTDEPEACGCGRHGCLEQYASATGVVRTYLAECERRGLEPVALDGPTDSLAVFAAHRTGDAAAKAAVSLMSDRLGFALAQVSAIIDPGLYLIGGGMGEGFDLFADELREAFRTYCIPACAGTRILPAALGNKAALYGSAYLAR